MKASNRTSLSTSVRRHFVDNFFFENAKVFKGKKIIDIGGKKTNKRGIFNIDEYSQDVTYVNIEKIDEPDIVADAANIPVNDTSYEGAIMGELLEHVPDPKLVLREVFRILKPGGQLVATVPFMYPVHADPHDYGRYTDTFWRDASVSIGFKSIEIKRQGTLFAVMALAIQHIFTAKNISWRPIQFPLVSFLMWLDKRTHSKLLCAWTTGYGIVFTK